jgi:hypothetical protein
MIVVLLLIVGLIVALVGRKVWRGRAVAPVVTITREPAQRLRLRSARRETL